MFDQTLISTLSVCNLI